MPALSDKTKLIKQQAILIQHALLCRGTCSLPFCDVMKTVIAHMGECQPGIKCAVRHCASSRAIFGHVKDCKKSTCPVCEPFATINDTQIENVEDKSLALWMQVVGPGSMNASTVERAVNTSSAFNGSMMETSFLDTSFGGAPDTQAMPSEREESATTATGSETSGQQSRANCAPAKGVPTTNGPRSAEVLNKAGPAAEKPTKSQHAIVAGSKPAREKANKMASPSGPPSANKKPAEKNAKPKEKQPATKRPSTGTATKANTTSEDVPANDVSSIDMPDLADEPSVDQPVTLEATSFLGGPLNMTHMNATASDASFSQINLVQSTPMFKKPKQITGKKQMARIEMRLGPGLDTSIVVPLPPHAQWTTSILAETVSRAINKSVSSSLFKVAQPTKDGVLVFESKYRACMKVKSSAAEKRKSIEAEQSEKKRSRKC